MHRPVRQFGQANPPFPAQDTLIASVVGLLCVSCVLFAFRQLDPSRIIASDAKKKKKELAKKLGRPIKLNQYEVRLSYNHLCWASIVETIFFFVVL